MVERTKLTIDADMHQFQDWLLDWFASDAQKVMSFVRDLTDHRWFKLDGLSWQIRRRADMEDDALVTLSGLEIGTQIFISVVLKRPHDSQAQELYTALVAAIRVKYENRTQETTPKAAGRPTLLCNYWAYCESLLGRKPAAMIEDWGELRKIETGKGLENLANPEKSLKEAIAALSKKYRK